MDINDPCVPPGFRFHPTEEELVGYYLKRKINSLKIDLDVIVDIDLYRIEPWDIQDRCKLGYEEQNEWYFFSHKDKKYPTGTRTNRATAAGFWKATGRDKAVLSKNKIIGMRKTLVFYKGRAPNGRKSDWIMHEYRLQTSQNAPPQEEGWVVCRAFKKPSPSTNRPYGYDPCWQNHNPNSNYYHMMRPNNISISTSLATAGSPSSLPELMSPNSVTIDSNYNHPPTAFHHQQPLPPFDFDHHHHHHHHHHEFSSSSTNTAFNQELGFVPSQDMSSWKFLDSLLACDQAPPCPDEPISQLPPLGDHNRVEYDESNADNNDQVGHFLTCFSDL